MENFYVGVKGIIVRDSKILTLKTTKEHNERWDIPGGRINGSEDIYETLDRELHEELPSIGKYKIERLVHVFRLPHNLSDGHGLLLVFYRIIAEEFEIILGEEHTEYRWIGAGEIDSLVLEDGYREAMKLALTN